MSATGFSQLPLARCLMRHLCQADAVLAGLLVHNAALSDRRVLQVRGRLRPLIVCRPDRCPIMLDHIGPEDPDYATMPVVWFHG